MQKNFSYPEHGISFLQMGITLLLLILLNLAVYSNPIDKNRERKASPEFLSEKPLTAERNGTITLSGNTCAIPPPECTITLPFTIEYVRYEAGSRSFSVNADNDCAWTPTVAQNSSWISFSFPTGQIFRGTQTLTFSYTVNPTTSQRIGTIVVSGHEYKVTQWGGPCRISLPSNAGSVPATAGEGTISVSAAGVECGWNADVAQNSSWIAIDYVQQDFFGSKDLIYSYQANPTTTPRKGTISVSGLNYTVTQAGTGTTLSCSYRLSSLESRIGSAASTAQTTGSFSVTVQGSGCSWNPTRVQTDTWITNVTKATTVNANGSWTVTYSFTANTSTTERMGTITVGDKTTHTVIQAGTATACSYMLPSLESRIGSAASTAQTTGSFSVTVQGSGCSWNPTRAPTDTWITSVTKAANANGSWTVTYSYTANTSTTERMGTITVGDKTHTVIQAGTATACSYMLPSLESRIGSAASTAQTTGSFSVTVQGSGCSWNPTRAPTDTWITSVTKAANANGSWTVTYSYTANTSTTERMGTITVGDKTHTVIQAGTATACSYMLPSLESRIGSAASTAQTTGSFSVTVQGSGCSWNPTRAPTDTWITSVTKAANANGSWTVTYSYTANTSTTERMGTITVGDKTHNVIQAGVTAACSYTLSSGESRIGSAASTAQTTGSFSVTVQGSGCSWTATTTDNWITNVTKAEKANANGKWDVTYSYLANTSTSERKGTITVAGQTHTVTQSGVVTGVEPISSMKLFPNPAKDFVTVDLSTDKTKYVWLKIVNQAGQILYKMDSPPAEVLQISLKGFAGGLYFIFLQGEEKALVQKLIVK